jgi:hypothetical protein
MQGLNCQAQPLDWSTLEHSFRSTLLKLHFSDNLLQPLPEGEHILPTVPGTPALTCTAHVILHYWK